MQNTEAGIVLLYLERKTNIYSQEFSVSGKKQVSLIWEECNKETSQSVTEIQRHQEEIVPYTKPRSNKELFLPLQLRANGKEMLLETRRLCVHKDHV